MRLGLDRASARGRRGSHSLRRRGGRGARCRLRRPGAAAPAGAGALWQHPPSPPADHRPGGTGSSPPRSGGTGSSPPRSGGTGSSPAPAPVPAAGSPDRRPRAGTTSRTGPVPPGRRTGRSAGPTRRARRRVPAAFRRNRVIDPSRPTRCASTAAGMSGNSSGSARTAGPTRLRADSAGGRVSWTGGAPAASAFATALPDRSLTGMRTPNPGPCIHADHPPIMTAPPIRPPLPAPFPTAVDTSVTGTVIVQLTQARVLESLPGPGELGCPPGPAAPNPWGRCRVALQLVDKAYAGPSDQAQPGGAGRPDRSRRAGGLPVPTLAKDMILREPAAGPDDPREALARMRADLEPLVSAVG